MPEDLRDRLAQAAADNGHGIGEEMRQRLQLSFEPERSKDPKTAELVAAIAGAAETITEHCAPWHESPWAFDVFKAAIETLLGTYRPSGEMVRPELNPNSAVAGIFFDHQSPDLSGQILAGVYLHRLAAERKG
jgi:hypothetical protein